MGEIVSSIKVTLLLILLGLALYGIGRLDLTEPLPIYSSRGALKNEIFFLKKEREALYKEIEKWKLTAEIFEKLLNERREA